MILNSCGRTQALPEMHNMIRTDCGALLESTPLFVEWGQDLSDSQYRTNYRELVLAKSHTPNFIESPASNDKLAIDRIGRSLVFP